MPVVERHPTRPDLEAFALGSLPDSACMEVEGHLVDCPDCRGFVEEAPGDTFISLLRSAKTRLECGDTPVTVAAGSPTEGWGSPPAGLVEAPAELIDHPRYRLIRLLGSGGMGAVWLAEHKVMGRLVALKLIRTEFLSHPGAAERFRREAQAAARLSHPNIVAAHDAEQAGPLHFLVMEYLDGVSLADRVASEGPLPVAEACRCIRDAALGLQHAHEQGLVHRDLKPHNLMAVRDPASPDAPPQVKVLDFGLAVLAAREPAGEGLTGRNMVLGTPDYIAPEQAEDARAADVRSDVYSLGCTLYYLLTGRVPFPVESTLRKLDSHRHREPEPVHSLRPEVSDGLVKVLSRMTAKAPDQRYQTPAQVANALEPFVNPGAAASRPQPGSRRRLLAALAAAALFLAAGMVAVRISAGRDREIVVETDDPEVEVVVKGDRIVRIVDPITGKSYRLDRDDLTLSLTDDPDGLAVTLDGDKPIVLSRRGKRLATVRLVPKPLPAADRVGMVRNFVGHTDYVNGVAILPGGQQGFTGSQDGTVRLWDLATGREVRKFLGHGNLVMRVAVSPDGTRAASASFDRTVRVWDIKTGKQLLRLDGHTDAVLGVVFSPDGRHLLTGSMDRTLRWWDAATGEELRCFRGHTDGVTQVALSPDGRTAASGCVGPFQGRDVWPPWGPGKDKSVRLWDVKTGKELRKLDGHTSHVWAVAFSPDGRRLLSGGEDNTIRLWDLVTGNQLRCMTVATKGFNCNAIAWLPDGRRFLAGHWAHGTLRLWDADTGRELQRLTGDADGVVLGIAVSADGRYALTGGWSNDRDQNDRAVRLWRLPDPPPPEKLSEVRQFTGHTGWVCNAVFHPDGKHIFSSSLDGTIRMWDRDTGRTVKVFRGHTSHLWSLDVSADGRRLVSGGGVVKDDAYLRCWDMESGKDLQRFSGTPPITYLALSHDGRRLITTTNTPVVRIWDVATGEELVCLHGHTESARPCLFSKDGRYVFTGGKDHTIRMWDAKTGKEVRRFLGHTHWVMALALTPDGKYLLSGGDKTVRLWEVATGKEVRCFTPHRSVVLSLAVSPDGRHFLSGEYDKRIRLWDFKTGEVLEEKSHGGTVEVVRFSSDGRFALSGGNDNVLRLWRLSAPAEGHKRQNQQQDSRP